MIVFHVEHNVKEVTIEKLLSNALLKSLKINKYIFEFKRRMNFKIYHNESFHYDNDIHHGMIFMMIFIKEFLSSSDEKY